MRRSSTWRLGFLLGLLAVLWTVLFPFLGQLGVTPLSLSAANIGAGFLFIAPYVLTLSLMLLSLLDRRTRPFSFGMAVPLLVFQLGLVLLAFFSQYPLVVVSFSLPGWLVLLAVGIAYYLSSVRQSRAVQHT